MKKTIIILVLVGVMAVVALVLFVFRSAPIKDNPELDAFAKCLTQKGAVVYGTDYCEWCQKQKADLGGGWQFINYVNCQTDPQKCVSQNIQGTPTWIFQDGSRLVGYQTLDKLSQQTSCPLPSVSK